MIRFHVQFSRIFQKIFIWNKTVVIKWQKIQILILEFNKPFQPYAAPMLYIATRLPRSRLSINQHWNNSYQWTYHFLTVKILASICLHILLFSESDALVNFTSWRFFGSSIFLVSWFIFILSEENRMLLCKLFALKPVSLQNFLVRKILTITILNFNEILLVLGGWNKWKSTDLGNWSISFTEKWQF